LRHGRTNHVHKTMHISDVTRSSKCTKTVDGWGLAPDPIGERTELFQTPKLSLSGLLLALLPRGGKRRKCEVNGREGKAPK